MSQSLRIWKTSASRALLLAGIGVACVTAQISPPAAPATEGTPSSKPAEVVPHAPVPGGPSAAVDSTSYKVASPDTLNIKVWHEQDFSGIYSVHPDGKITMPLIGDVEAGGRTPADIEKTVKEALAKYVVNPLVTVTVQEVLSRRYYMDGEIGRPGEYSLVSSTTVLEAISKAGGLAGFANPKKIYILRGDQRIAFNYKDVIHGKHLEQNIQLQPGDHIVTP